MVGAVDSVRHERAQGMIPLSQIDRRPRAPDSFGMLRRVDLDAVTASVSRRITADGRYLLSVNGTVLGRGPGRGRALRLRYDTYDLAPDLVVGENVIGIFARSFGSPVPYWKPAADR